ncbi:hypothetical protein F0Q45_25125 [Mycobacterium simiae]|uniref:Uncharacterized protein n=1 Tax=Mycobacterium simiae TaxID=1784 RepID=A0A5B1B878_MYCSI|nr:hypothetical protein [Mycobacterium simiae]KAA1244121.1 hypothetical protein F0Q45_25125 [Mycobacterium simiae]
MPILKEGDPDIVELIGRYSRWRRIYGYAGKAAPDEADLESGRLHFRFGYPYPDWWAFILEGSADGRYRCLRASTERSVTPVETSQGNFARIQDAGKFIIYNIAESLRIDCRMEPISWRWDDAGLDPLVNMYIESYRTVKYVLRNNSNAYFIMTRGDMAYSHILPLSYDELDAVLLDGFPESVMAQLNAESG